MEEHIQEVEVFLELQLYQILALEEVAHQLLISVMAV